MNTERGTSRRLGPLAALALIALIGAGCSNDDSGAGNADAASANADSERAVEFAECMRENGVADFPDPDASGELTIDGVVNGSSLDPSAPAWEAAMGACKDLQPPGFTGTGRSAEEQEAALEFAQCMRDNGVDGFPDPAPDAPLIDTTRIPGSPNPQAPWFQAAMEACGDLPARAGVTGP